MSTAAAVAVATARVSLAPNYTVYKYNTVLKMGEEGEVI